MEFPRGSHWFSHFNRGDIMAIVAYRIKYSLVQRLSASIKGIGLYEDYDQLLEQKFSEKLGWNEELVRYEAAEIEEVVSMLSEPIVSQLYAAIEKLDPNPCVVWSIEIKDLVMHVHHCGDWRINEWESQNLDENGRYTGVASYRDQSEQYG
ncbi:hypothetical protein [Vibrio phage BONAISHI]|nr:hypothetical protein [Vibrio phage BONAISHI]